MISSSELGSAIGAAIGTEILFFPITYLVLKDRFKLRRPNGAWLPFLYGIGSVVLLVLLGFKSNNKSEEWVILFDILAVVVNAIILKLTYSGNEPQEVSKNIVESNGKKGNSELMIYASEGDIENAKETPNKSTKSGAGALMTKAISMKVER